MHLYVPAYHLICCIVFEILKKRVLSGGSDEGSQQMFLCRTNKTYPKLSPNTLSYPELWCVMLKVPLLNKKNKTFSFLFYFFRTKMHIES